MKTMHRTAAVPFSLAPFIAVALVPMAAWAHQDVEIGIASGRLTTSGGVYPTGSLAGLVFESEMIPGSPPSTNEPGFEAAIGTFQPGDKVRFDFVYQLLYWNGTVLAPPPSNLTVSFGSNSATISGADTGGLPGFLIAEAGSQGDFHKDLDFSLQPDAAEGLYGIVLKLAPDAGTTGFSDSNRFLIGFVNGTVADVPGGLDAMVEVAAVPEPGTLALAAAGAAVLALAARRRRSRKA